MKVKIVSQMARKRLLFLSRKGRLLLKLNS
jgi:hypothetical protein